MGYLFATAGTGRTVGQSCFGWRVDRAFAAVYFCVVGQVQVEQRGLQVAVAEELLNPPQRRARLRTDGWPRCAAACAAKRTW